MNEVLVDADLVVLGLDGAPEQDGVDEDVIGLLRVRLAGRRYSSAVCGSGIHTRLRGSCFFASSGRWA